MALVTPVVLVVVTAGLLLWQFPLGFSMASVETYVSVTERSYLLMVLLFPALGIFANLLAARYTKTERLMRVGITLGLSLLLGTAVCLGLGLSGVEIPGTHVRQVFFADGKYLTVLFAIALPVSCVTAVTTGLRSLWVMSGGEADA